MEQNPGNSNYDQQQYQTQLREFSQGIQRIQAQLATNNQPIPQSIRNLNSELENFQKWCTSNEGTIQQALSGNTTTAHTAGNR